MARHPEAERSPVATRQSLAAAVQRRSVVEQPLAANRLPQVATDRRLTPVGRWLRATELQHPAVKQ